MNAIAERAVITRAIYRLIPFLFLLYVVAYLDRVNVGFAQLQMKHDLGLSDKAYGFGAGVFFLGYFLFEIPSNLILERVGARLWIARIMATWGLIAMAMMFTRSPASFCLLRFLLGLAEAGFFPGIILYLTYWFTAAERGRIVAWFMTANAVAFIVGGPLSGKLLTFSGVGHLAGWQWLFVVEGIPALLLGGVVLFYLPDGPIQASWLSPEECTLIQARLRGEQNFKARYGEVALRRAFATPAVWLLCSLYLTMVVGMYGISLWLPQLVKQFSGFSDFEVGVLTAVPYLAAAVSMVLVGIHSDRTGERRLHVAIPAFVGALGLAGGAFLHAPLLALLSLTVAAAGMWATLGPFWALPTGFLGGTAAAGGIALINSVGNLGGFVGPYLVGYIKNDLHSFTGGLLTLAISMALAGLIAIAVRHKAAVDSADAIMVPASGLESDITGG